MFESLGSAYGFESTVTSWADARSEARGGEMLKVAFNMVANCDIAKSGRLPVLTAGGAITSGEPLMFGGAFDQRSEATLFSNGPNEHLAPLASRSEQWRATRQQNRFPDRSQSAAFWRTLTFHYQLADYRS